MRLCQARECAGGATEPGIGTSARHQAPAPCKDRAVPRRAGWSRGGVRASPCPPRLAGLTANGQPHEDECRCAIARADGDRLRSDWARLPLRCGYAASTTWGLPGPLAGLALLPDETWAAIRSRSADLRDDGAPQQSVSRSSPMDRSFGTGVYRPDNAGRHGAEPRNAVEAGRSRREAAVRRRVWELRGRYRVDRDGRVQADAGRTGSAREARMDRPLRRRDLAVLQT
jgi:hypothetical protein